MINQRASVTHRGTTLIEMIMVILVLSILISVGGVLLGVGFRGGFASTDSIYVASIARAAMEQMTSNLLEARYSGSSDLTIGTNSITFTNINGNSISFSRSGNNLMRNSKILSDYTTALTFTYLDENNSVTATPANVRCIGINASFAYNTGSVSLQSLVCPRNYSL